MSRSPKPAQKFLSVPSLQRSQSIQSDTEEKTLSDRESDETSRGRFLRPKPPVLKPLLRLSNLLPLYCHYPRWQRHMKPPDGSTWEATEFHFLRSEWSPGDTVEQRHFEWSRFLVAIDELPLELRSFILEDRLGEALEIDGNLLPYLDHRVPNYENFDVLTKPTSELLKVVEASQQRYEVTCALERLYAAPRPALILPRQEQSFAVGSRTYFYQPSEQLLRRARQRLLFILAVQETLYCLTRLSSGKDPSVVTKERLDDAERHLQLRLMSSLHDATGTLVIVRDEKKRKGDEYVLKEYSSPVYGLLTEYNVKVNRIRECPVCYRLFWAGRLDAGQCGESKCKSVLSTRRSREDKDNYNSARARKRAKGRSSKVAKKGK